jgi:hypothetical protein
LPGRSPPTTRIRDFHTQRRRQVDLVVLLINEDLPNKLGHGKFTERFALSNPRAIIFDCLIFIAVTRSTLFLKGNLLDTKKLLTDRPPVRQLGRSTHSLSSPIAKCSVA